MPTYRYRCETCEIDQDVWESIHAEAQSIGTCGHPIVRVIVSVATLHIGSNPEVRNADATEARWHKDMPAYKRFREKGYQPPGIDGCDRLEATAQSNIEIQSGGRLKYSDERVNEGKQQAEDIMKGRV